ncbi:alpha-amylase family glycosyl hydrolase [Nonomuraea dietziae]|uniref:alpha-amylase family glycosyl hydrolase n=1 Tax=Nonomuraea dietziae TaxID=65515 RepID=UPI003CD087F0
MDIPWWRDAVVYEIYVRSFADASGDGVGDLVGVRERLPYLAQLGVDAIWLTPFYPSPMADGGYDVADYRGVDPIPCVFEKMHARRLLRRWCGRRAHARMKGAVDIVPNQQLLPASLVPGVRWPAGPRAPLRLPRTNGQHTESVHLQRASALDQVLTTGRWYPSPPVRGISRQEARLHCRNRRVSRGVPLDVLAVCSIAGRTCVPRRGLVAMPVQSEAAPDRRRHQSCLHGVVSLADLGAYSLSALSHTGSGASCWSRIPVSTCMAVGEVWTPTALATWRCTSGPTSCTRASTSPAAGAVVRRRRSRRSSTTR